MTCYWEYSSSLLSGCTLKLASPAHKPFHQRRTQRDRFFRRIIGHLLHKALDFVSSAQVSSCLPQCLTNSSTRLSIARIGKNLICCMTKSRGLHPVTVKDFPGLQLGYTPCYPGLIN